MLPFTQPVNEITVILLSSGRPRQAHHVRGSAATQSGRRCGDGHQAHLHGPQQRQRPLQRHICSTAAAGRAHVIKWV